jgi:probable HAF family extracellular repeat protein
MVGLGDLPDGDFDSDAYGVSADGLTLFGVGNTRDPNGPPRYVGFRWTAEKGMVALRAGDSFMLYPQAASADGAVVVGQGILNNQFNELVASRWTEQEGIVGLGDLPGGIFRSSARGISADGSVVVGSASSPNGGEAFRWTEDSGMVGLGDLPGGAFGSNANAVSADGSVVVGTGNSASGLEAFRWTPAGGMVGLGDLPGSVFRSVANAVSADCSVVVGSGNVVDADGIGDAFYWTEATGMIKLRDLLTTLGASNLDGWSLISATGVSADGQTIVGSGTNPSGTTEAWVATIPEPYSLVLAAIGGLLACFRHSCGRARAFVDGAWPAFFMATCN